jgi:hypothetical protein
MKKDTIYIEADDEITAITDKLVGSSSSIVAFVLPKRCPTLQSAVNLKILNKTASQQGKNLVLITSEPAIMQIAGMTGMYVAKTLQSKPFIPESNAVVSNGNEVQEIAEDDLGDSLPEEAPPQKDETETVIETAPKKQSSKAKKPSTKDKKDKKLKVPNFDTFRNKLFWIAGGIIALVALFVLATVVLPKATITVTAETQPVDVNTSITAEAGGTSNNIDEKTFELQTKTIEKTDSKKAPATGERNDGTKASGNITIYNCDNSDGFTLPANTVFSTGFSGGTASFVSTESVVVPKFTGSALSCKVSSPFTGAGKASVSVTATQPGSTFNLSSGRTYSIQSLSEEAEISAVGGAMGGGQDKITKIVSNDDCEKAKNDALASLNSDDYKKQLQADFEKEGIIASTDTFSSKTVSISCSPAVGSVANEVTATAKMQYTMSGVDSKALGELITKLAVEQAGPGQNVVDTGLSKATLSIKQTKSNGDIVFAVKTTAQVGLKQDQQAIAESVKGKNARQTADTIKALNGVKDVKVNYSPFWVGKTPKNTKKVKIVFINESATQ